MINCSNCGAGIPDDAAFCEQCGAPRPDNIEKVEDIDVVEEPVIDSSEEIIEEPEAVEVVEEVEPIEPEPIPEEMQPVSGEVIDSAGPVEPQKSSSNACLWIVLGCLVVVLVGFCFAALAATLIFGLAESFMQGVFGNALLILPI